MSKSSTVAASLPTIIVSRVDSERLNLLLDSLTDVEREAASGLEAELARAELVEPDQMPADVVTMHARVLYEDRATGQQREAVLVYPHEADSMRGRLSVLAPLGSALLGLRPGQEIDWPVPLGRRKRIRLLRVIPQPSFAKDLTP